VSKNTDKNDKITKDYAKIFSERLSAVVEKLGWSQTEFGRRMGLTQAMAGRYMGGKANPTFETLAKIEAATRVPVAKFFENNQPLPKPLIESNLSEDVRAAIEDATSDSSKLLHAIAAKLGPVLEKLAPEGTSQSTEVKAAPKDKFTRFINKFLRDVGLTGNFYRLLDEDAAEEVLRLELLREITVTVLSEGGNQAKKARQMLNELLAQEKNAKR
jgi:transcriptional regulator with XRE-family HTH domain